MTQLNNFYWITKLIFFSVFVSGLFFYSDINAVPCIDPPIAGTPVATISVLCSGQTTTIGLLGGTSGTGQTYEWQSAASIAGPFIDIPGGNSDSVIVSPTTSTYYLCKVVCGGASSTSGILQITVNPVGAGGYFTINKTLPTGAGNFNSFSDAVNALACGISGAVIFEVVPGTGPYNEQISIPQVSGASTINTITFSGNNQELIYSATNSNVKHTLKLDGADYCRFNNLNIIGAGTYAYVCYLTNQANNNIFNYCTFTAPPETFNQNHVPFILSPSVTTVPSGSDNVISNCTMYNGYYNIFLNGITSLSDVGNTVNNCSFYDAGNTAVMLSYQSGAIVSGGIIERPTRYNVQNTFTGCKVSTGCKNVLIEKNKFRNYRTSCPFCAGANTNISSITIDAISTAGNENKIFNNLISHIFHTGNAPLIGITVAGSYAKVYHNTIVLDDIEGPNSGIVRTCGIYCQVSSSIDIKNNLVSISRAGLADKFCLNFFPTSSAINSNHNDLFIGVSGIGNFIGSYQGNYATLSAWQGANGNIWDQQSVNINPAFLNPSIYDYRPSVVALDNKGTNVGVTTDINGMARSVSAPDIGCYEFTIYPIDIGVSSFITPDSTGCYGMTAPVEVTIKNYGFTTIDFSINPVTVSCLVSGGIANTLNTLISLGVLAPGASMNITLPALNMTGTGTYTFLPFTNLSGDNNSSNDTLPYSVIRTVGPLGGIITSSPSSACVSFTPTLTLTGNYGGSLQWQSSTISAAGPWINVGNGGATYTPSFPVSQTTWYRVELSCGGNLAYSEIDTFIVNAPQVVSVTGGTRCGYGSVGLNATGSLGTTLSWYINPADLIPVGSGNSFNTPNIDTTTAYYVAATAGAGPTHTNLMTTTTSNNSLFGNLFDMNVLNPIRIDSFSIKATAPGTFVDLYYRIGTGTGFTSSLAGWIFLGSATINTITSPLSVIPLNVNLTMIPGLYSFAFKTSSAVQITNGTSVGNIFVADANVQIREGFGGTSLTNFSFGFSPAVWNGKLYYTTSACESAKTPVLATVNSSPSITTIAANSSLCPGTSTTISVSSPNPDYTYSWTSNPSGFLGNGTGPFTVTPASTTSYVVTATDNTNGVYGGCGDTSSVTVATSSVISAGVVTSSISDLCISGTPTLAVNGAGGTIQWQESLTGVNGSWINVGAGLSSYIPSSPIAQTTYYRVISSCQLLSYNSNIDTVTVSQPLASITSITTDTICGNTSATLSAVSTALTPPIWYATPTGGIPLGSGNSFVTPVISSDTNFYVSASPGVGGTATALMPPEYAIGNNLGAKGYWFTVPIAMTITAVKIPSTGQVSGSSQSIAIVKFNGNVPPPLGTFSGTNAFTPLFLTQLNPSPGMIPCNVSISPGEVIGIIGLRNNSYSEGPPGYGAPTPVIVNGNYLDLNPLSMPLSTPLNTNPPQNLHYTNSPNLSSTIGRVEFEYNLGTCDEIRTAVPVSVTPAPSINLVNLSPVICAGGSSILFANSTNPDYTYTWTNIGFTGFAITVYPTSTSTYYVTAIDNTNGPYASCISQASTSVTVNPLPVVSLTTTPSVICQGDNSIISASSLMAPTYCDAGSTTNGCGSSLPGYYISSVQFGSINNNSSCGTPSASNYENFTSLSTTVSAGATYPISVTVALWYIYDSFWVWIDYNHDGEFGFLERTTLNSATVATGNITIPANALNGSTRMRIRVGYSGPTYSYEYPCGYALYGEVEDYTINITGGIVSPFTWLPATYLSSTIGDTITAISMSNTTTYTVTSTNSYGCTNTASTTVIVQPGSYSIVIDTTCTSPYLWNGNSYTATGTYTFTTFNSAGCDSVATLHLTMASCNSLALRCFIQGYWDGSSGMFPVLFTQGEPTTAGACDSINVELHNATAPYGLVTVVRTVLQQNGTAACVFPSVSGMYYVVVKHRNAVETWSAVPIAIGLAPATYDFTTQASKAYGSNQTEVAPGVWAFYIGDLQGDENVDLLDLLQVETDVANFNYGYLATDLNGDSNVDLLDNPIIEMNISSFIFSSHP